MLSNKLKELRREKDMTLEDLAERIGTSRQTIHRYENGIISNIPHDKVKRLAEALGVSPSALMGWDSDFSSFDNISPISIKKLPVIGEIACGEPIFAEERYEGYVSTDYSLDASFCLIAKGDSMTGARIFDGDVVFIRAQEWVDNGEIAAVIINDEATLKRFYYYPEEQKLVLSPENPRYAPFVYIKEELDGVKVIGKAVAFQSKLF